MPVVSSPETVLVTGASGFIGSWVVKTLLEKRYTVRATGESFYAIRDFLPVTLVLNSFVRSTAALGRRVLGDTLREGCRSIQLCRHT